MPFGTATILMRENAPYHSCAQFLAFIAYPDPADTLRRQEFLYAAAIWSIRLRASIEPEWADQPQSIVPRFLSGPLHQVAKFQKQGAKRLLIRMMCAKDILLPVLYEVHINKYIAPRLENILQEKLLPSLKYQANSASTFKSRYWAPSRPVAPAALALLAWMQSRQSETKQLSDHIFIDLFFEINQLREVLNLTRQFRSLADGVTRYEVRKSDTMRFVEADYSDQENARD